MSRRVSVEKALTSLLPSGLVPNMTSSSCNLSSPVSLPPPPPPPPPPRPSPGGAMLGTGPLEEGEDWDEDWAFSERPLLVELELFPFVAVVVELLIFRALTTT